MATIKDFEKLDIKVAEILSVQHIPKADKLYVMQADVGGKQIQLVAGIKEYYKPEELKGKKILVVTNLEPVKIRGVESQGMLLAAVGKDDIVLTTVDRDVPPGTDIA